MGTPTKPPAAARWDESEHETGPNEDGPRSGPSTLGTMLYMLLSLATGICYFTWAVVGLSVSLPLVVLLVGIPLLMMFLMSVRLVGVIEGWLVEGLLGVPMSRGGSPTRDLAGGDRGLLGAFLDRRTWSTLAYMVLMLPVGIVYFVLVVVGFSVPIALTGGSLAELVSGADLIQVRFGPGGADLGRGHGSQVALAAIGAALTLLMTHVVRWVGALHARFARAMLVRE